MNISYINEVEVHPLSDEYITKIFNRYKEKEIEAYGLTIDSPILHLYPISDTRDLSTGELNGYIDALFFELHIYDPQERVVYKTKQYDGILPIGDLKITQIKLFKDLSTLIALSGKYTFSFGIAVTVYVAD